MVQFKLQSIESVVQIYYKLTMRYGYDYADNMFDEVVLSIEHDYCGILNHSQRLQVSNMIDRINNGGYIC